MEHSEKEPHEKEGASTSEHPKPPPGMAKFKKMLKHVVKAPPMPRKKQETGRSEA